jgi:hypothetical protein
MSKGIIASRYRFAKRVDTTAENVLVIGYWSLRFICNLVFVIWRFTVFYDPLSQII